MAEVLTIGGQEYKRRSPWGVWGLTFLTLGIYGLVWYFKINDEARRYLGDDRIKPGLAVLAQFVPIVQWVSIYNTGERIGRMQDKVGDVPSRVVPILGVVASLFLVLHIVYYQAELNKVWDRAQQAPELRPGPTQSPPQIPPPPPPPPASEAQG